jgi:hypothetical protein
MNRATLVVILTLFMGCSVGPDSEPVSPTPLSELTMKDVGPLPGKWPEIVAQWDGSMSKAMPEPIRAVLEHATDLELISLYPWESPTGEEAATYGERRVLGSVRISDPKARKALLAALSYGLSQDEGFAECFDPRHRIRIVSNGKTYDVTICFACTTVETYVDGKRNEDFTVPIGEGAQVFNAFLTAANIPIEGKTLKEDN